MSSLGVTVSRKSVAAVVVFRTDMDICVEDRLRVVTYLEIISLQPGSSRK